ncbi:hypothetical protein RB595_000551 [Gaeumannomyces hyphopodioides]
MSSGGILPALGHAASGSLGAAIATAATYPLDLINTRLKVQRQLAARDGGGGGGAGDAYDGAADALRRILRDEGGPSALFVGLASDVAKSAADSFLFFLFYSWLRSHRLVAGGGSGGKKRKSLGAVEELLVGAVAGAAARALTMPVANAVARMQTAALAADRWNARKSVAGELRDMWGEKGVQGLWAGYSAALVLTLNPSITFCLDRVIRGVVAGRGKPRGGGGGGSGGGGRGGEFGGFATFLSAAVSKAAATALTYPFQIAKARLQVSNMMASPAVPRAPSPPTPPPPPFVPPVIIEPTPPPESENRRVRMDDAHTRPADLTEVNRGDAATHDDRDEIDSNHSHISHISHMTADDGLTGGGLGLGIRNNVFHTPMIGSPQDDVVEEVKEAVVSAAHTVGTGVKKMAHDNVFTMLLHISKSEGPGALYDGLAGELLRAFFSHGITMLSKDLLHKLVVRLYFSLIAARRTIDSGRRPRADPHARDQPLLASVDFHPHAPSPSSHIPLVSAAARGHGPPDYSGRYPTSHNDREPVGYGGERGGPAYNSRLGGLADHDSYNGPAGYRGGPSSYGGQSGYNGRGSYDARSGHGTRSGYDDRGGYGAGEPTGHRRRAPARHVPYREDARSQHSLQSAQKDGRGHFGFGRASPEPTPTRPVRKAVREATDYMLDSSHRMVKDRS